ncbi:hypothetical protein [Nitrosopumilus sp.]|uniref:hypothetical protein n=1 Tax=Nitrosopumilus sp. TaxID=2024843 RepID=UPI002625B7A2|nr:hypothetical protein [Nitrosopumilus sp.]
MFQFKISKSVDPLEWNQNLLKSEFSTFFQTYEYIQSQSIDKDNFPIFIEIFDGENEIKGQLGMIIHKSATVYSSKKLKKIINLFSDLGKRGNWAGGPIIHSKDKKDRLEILKIIILALEKVGRDYNLAVVDGYTPHQDNLIDENIRNEFKKSNYQIENFFTFVTSLEQSLDDIWEYVHKSTKRDVNRAKKREIKIKELSEFSELDNYFDLSKTWAKTKGIDVEQILKRKDGYWKCIESKIDKIFLAFENEELVSAHLLGVFNNIAFSHKLTNSYSKATSLGGPLLTWHAIEWAKKSGMKIYDYSGGKSPPIDKNELEKYHAQWDSLLSYKRKWGGKEFPYFHVLKIRRSSSYKMFRILSKIDWTFRNYKRKQFQRPNK